MIRIKLITRFKVSFKSLFLMNPRKLSIGMRETRAEYKNKKEDFTEDIMFFKEPFKQFKTWFDEACNTPSIIEPRAMCLVTSTSSGIPSARFVILRSYSPEGFKFFTNFCSRKGKELKENPNAALAFYWESLKRSVRIEGVTKKLSDEESTQFFHSRSKGYQIEAAFSDQSQPISSRNALSEKEKKFKSQFENYDCIPKPKEWGGFILKPHAIEFWEGQIDGLQDRIQFRVARENEVIDNILLHQGENGWVYKKLQP